MQKVARHTVVLEATSCYGCLRRTKPTYRATRRTIPAETNTMVLLQMSANASQWNRTKPESPAGRCSEMKLKITVAPQHHVLCYQGTGMTSPCNSQCKTSLNNEYLSDANCPDYKKVKILPVTPDLLCPFRKIYVLS